MLFSHKIQKSFPKWCGSTSYLRQPSSANNRLAPKISVKVFYTVSWLIPLSQ